MGRLISDRMSYRNHYMCGGEATSEYYNTSVNYLKKNNRSIKSLPFYLTQFPTKLDLYITYTHTYTHTQNLEVVILCVCVCVCVCVHVCVCAFLNL